MLLSLNGVTGTVVGKIPFGHLAIVRGLLAIRAYDSRHPDAMLIVQFPSDSAPRLSQHKAETQCVDLGPHIIVTGLSLNSFDQDHRHSAAGNIVFDREGTAIICSDRRADETEARVDIRTGALHAATTDCYYASTWQLGLIALDGSFQELYKGR